MNQVLVRLWARSAAATDRMVVRFSLWGLRDVLQPGNVFRGAYNVLSEVACRVTGPLHRRVVRVRPVWVVSGGASWGVDGSCALWVIEGSP